MKSILEPSPVSYAPRESNPCQENGGPAWEYRFVLQEEWSPAGSGITELAPEGWVVASFRTRLDNQREYLLKRRRK